VFGEVPVAVLMPVIALGKAIAVSRRTGRSAYMVPDPFERVLGCAASADSVSLELEAYEKQDEASAGRDPFLRRHAEPEDCERHRLELRLERRH